jgi:2-methylisocitrate lyase-like PEP mutase family enzyme
MTDDEIWTQFVYMKGMSERERAVTFARAVEQASRRAALSEAGITAVIHSQYPVTTDFDRGYAKARADAAKAIRALLEGDTK